MTKVTCETIMTALSKAAAKAGVDVTGLRVEAACLDRTWGDLDGFVFYGADMGTCERAAQWFLRWYKPGASSYEAQTAVRPKGVYTFRRYANGAKGWCAGNGADSPFVACVERRVGVAVSTHYYPCAE
jgi:hypothetical protein